MKSIAIIPARGGSKRLPRKNIIDFLGHPIINYTIRAALETELFERVVVSTEDEEIADVARKGGAEVIMRPDSLATDDARVYQVCLDVLAQEETRDISYDVLCCLYATAPLRNAKDIMGTMAPVLEGESECCLAVTDFSHYPFQALAEAEDGTLSPMWSDLVEKRADALPPLWAGNGSTYAVTVDMLRREQSFHGPGLKGFRMPKSRSIDIDTADDLLMAKAMAAAMNLT